VAISWFSKPLQMSLIMPRFLKQWKTLMLPNWASLDTDSWVRCFSSRCTCTRVFGRSPADTVWLVDVTGIAEQMGRVLQRTSISVNMKERCVVIGCVEMAALTALEEASAPCHACWQTNITRLLCGGASVCADAVLVHLVPPCPFPGSTFLVLCSAPMADW